MLYLLVNRIDLHDFDPLRSNFMKYRIPVRDSIATEWLIIRGQFLSSVVEQN